MGTRTSRTAFPIRDAKQGGAIGTWGIWLTMALLGTALAGLVVSGIYLYWGQEAWPPEDFSAPARGLGALALVLSVAAAATCLAALRALRAGLEQLSGHVLFGGLALGLASIAAMVRDLATVGWRWDEHVYTSLYWIFVGNAVLFVAIAVMMTAAVLVQRLANALDVDRHLELEITVVFWGYAVLTVASMFGVVHLLPHR
jgi:heme/copper-type cytochrome/quinol oxidase subunit 3